MVPFGARSSSRPGRSHRRPGQKKAREQPQSPPTVTYLKKREKRLISLIPQFLIFHFLQREKNGFTKKSTHRALLCTAWDDLPQLCSRPKWFPIEGVTPHEPAWKVCIEARRWNRKRHLLDSPVMIYSTLVITMSISIWETNTVLH